MIFENRVSSQFAQKVQTIATRLKIDSNHLMAVMWSESRLNHKAKNPTGGATGLIQFMPSTARHLGTSTEELYNMSDLEQLDWVEKFFKSYAPKCKTFADLYMACFFPLAIGKGDDFVLQTKNLSAQLIAKQNPIFDANKDSKIMVGEFKERLKTIFPNEIHPYLF